MDSSLEQVSFNDFGSENDCHGPQTSELPSTSYVQSNLVAHYRQRSSGSSYRGSLPLTRPKRSPTQVVTSVNHLDGEKTKSHSVPTCCLMS